ncbi:hypothetical protein [Sporosarcina luteola]|uniref:hypothetical protein n=1 Tax=Sporosarcina luteola TaxID=582850 RepID=UPI00203DA78C|nr:hypothetical protein [Sporosarcina luteola]MCM3711283.1 hypothetical protein [Sporosarcina luteola]
MKSKKTILSSIIALALALVIIISCSLVIQNVGSINQIFFPMVTAIVDSQDSMEEWGKISFNDENDLIFDSIFWNK